MDEIEEIKKRYEARKTNLNQSKYDSENFYTNSIIGERELIYKQIITKYFKQLNTLKILEIGAGTGGNLNAFIKFGIPANHIIANELIKERINVLKLKYPESIIIEGNALDINEDYKFDVVFQSTVFTSILDDEFKKKLANKMLDLTNQNGIIIWYDFIYNNPKNKDVKGVTKKEIKQLFAAASKIHFYSVTLAPPIGRRVGKLYAIINKLFPFLRSHVIAVIEK